MGSHEPPPGSGSAPVPQGGLGAPHRHDGCGGGPGQRWRARQHRIAIHPRHGHMESQLAPGPRGLVTAVWTGQKMFIWGGGGSVIFGDGGLYDPIADLWQPVSIVNAPVGRNSATSVWTGSRVVVWGGHSGPDTFNTGGLYDPASDSWSQVSTTNAPSARTEHTAVWTGSRMLIWGGRGGSNGGMPTNTGGQYDPAADSWMATNTTGAPTPRYKHTAVWTGSRMIVRAGHSPSEVLN